MNQKNRPKVNEARLTIILVVIIGFFLAVMIYILKQVKKDGSSPAKPVVEEIQPEEETEEVKNAGSICVIKNVDTTERTIVLYDTQYDRTVKLSYTGGTDIRDQYAQIIAASQLSDGEMAEAVYQESDQTLQSLIKSKDAWEYTNVTGLNPDRTNKMIRLYGDKYRYTSKLFVTSPDGECGLLSINTDDVLTVRGYDKYIYSIVVTKGHGSIVLENCNYLAGGTLTIGGRDYLDFSEDSVFTVREGKTEIEIKKGELKESLSVEVLRNQEVKVDLGVYAPNPEEKGAVTFVISPFGAELFIDDAFMSYAKPIELTYGEHTIEVSLNGYETYTGSYTLNAATDIVQIELPKTVVEEKGEESTEETQNQSTTPQPVPTTGPGNTSSNSSPSAPTATPTPSATPTVTPSVKPEADKENAENDTKDTDPDHTITIKTPTGASVYINGVFQGIAPVTVEKPLGMTYITLLKEGYEQITHTVNIQDDGENKQYQFPKLVQEEE